MQLFSEQSTGITEAAALTFDVAASNGRLRHLIAPADVDAPWSLRTCGEGPRTQFIFFFWTVHAESVHSPQFAPSNIAPAFLLSLSRHSNQFAPTSANFPPLT
jgi:hypothetical protein